VPPGSGTQKVTSMAKIAYCFIDNGQMLLGVYSSGAGEKVTEVRMTIDKNMLELMEGAVDEARIDFDERQASGAVRLAWPA
jgi:hypothetical protein